MYQTIKQLEYVNLCFLNHTPNPKSCLTIQSSPSDNQLYYYQSDTNNPLHCNPQSNNSPKK